MPLYLRKADVKPEHLKTGLLEKVGKSMFITAQWADMRAILKAVIIRWPSKYIRFTSDAEIRDVYVGSKSKAARSADYEGEIYNSLSDLVGPPDLCIIRLNEIANKNKAAAGALEEVLSHRLDRDKPTWILSNTEKQFMMGSFAYSDAVAELLHTGFTHITVRKILAPLPLDGVGGIFATDYDPHQQSRPRPRPREISEEVQTSGQGEAPGMSKGAQERPTERPKGPKTARSSDDVDGGVDSTLAQFGAGVKKGKSRFGRED